MVRIHALIAALSILSLLAAPALGAPPAPADPAMTIGEFALQVARLAQPDAARRASLTPERAAESLRRAGLKLQGSLAAPLTEGEVAQFFRQAGIDLRTAQPDQAVSSRKTAALLSTFGSLLTVRAQDPSTLILLETSPRAASAEDFSDCAALPTVSECRACCLALSDTANTACGRGCGRAHAAQNVSASEPTP
jgi:hypothetical protein